MKGLPCEGGGFQRVCSLPRSPGKIAILSGLSGGFLPACSRTRGSVQKDWKGSKGIPIKGIGKSIESHELQGNFRVFSGYFQGVFGFFSGYFQEFECIFRVFAGVSPCALRVCPVDAFKKRLCKNDSVSSMTCFCHLKVRVEVWPGSSEGFHLWKRPIKFMLALSQRL